MKKGGNNSSTPARASQNITVRKPRPPSPPSPPSPVADPPTGNNSALNNLTEQIKLLRHEILTMKSDFDAAISAVSRCESRIDEMSATMAIYESRLKLAEELKVEVVELKKVNDSLQSQISFKTQAFSAYESRLKLVEDSTTEMSNLMKAFESHQDQTNFLAQARLRNDIEISGISEKPAENPLHLFLTLAVVAGMKLSESDIDYVTRTGPPRKNTNDPPRPLVVRFCRRSTRDRFYSTAKPRRLSTKDLKIEGSAQNIYFNDRLTRENRQLFRECRTIFKEAGYKFCWTKWGQIYVKKREGGGKDAKAIIVRSHSDIANIIKGPA